jgi:two-component system sensor histidine kinase KdpD
LEVQAQQAKVIKATEDLQNALLNSISHDLRTPLVSITGALSSLQEDDGKLDGEMRAALIENAREETERLNRLVGNLLDMSRLEAGAMRLARETSDIEDAIGSALEQLDRRLLGRQVKVDVADDVPLVPMDFSLIVQVLVNLIDNALKYSPRDTPIEIRVRAQPNQIQVQVMDRGLGIPSEDLPHVFDKFYRVQHPDMVSGTGMGLAICRGIVAAHGGTITAENRLGGGALITFTLPKNQMLSTGTEGQASCAVCHMICHSSFVVRHCSYKHHGRGRTCFGGG